MKKILKLLFSRLVITSVLILIQVLFFIFVIWKLSNYFIYITLICILLSFLILLYIMNKDESPSLKLPWILLILLFPIFGGMFYLMFAQNRFHKKDRERIIKIYQTKKKICLEENIKKLENIDYSFAGNAKYIAHRGMFPLYTNTETKYFKIGEEMYESLLDDLKKAEKFIFMEYFIIEDGKFWNSILDVLEEKAKEGIDVRVIFDDMGCILTLPNHYEKTLTSKGIKCTIFNEYKPILSIGHNNRDHRKITVIDGFIGYTGGINLADEYINAKVKYGHWKDTAIRLYGEGVANLTDLFLTTWNYLNHKNEKLDNYTPYRYHKEEFKGEGFVQAFGDNPIDKEKISETVILNMIYSASKYIYINTPYLIVSYEILEALSIASKRGVDVKITTPHIPDKWYVHIMTQSHYKYLLKSGVKIYEYEPGFIHAKSFVIDDKVAMIGTINLDYRSLIHHFECGVYMYGTSSIKDMKEDYEKTLQKCIQIKEKDIKRLPFYKRWTRNILQFFSPLL